MGILNAIGLLFGKLMYFIYNTIGVHNYALSLVFFTIVYKVILLPLSIKQMKSTQLMQDLQPELQRIQDRYKNDKEKLQEEQMKFYQEKGYNPTSGCLPLLIQMPIILALFYVIRMPMSYMLELPARAVSHMAIASIQNKDLEFKNIDLGFEIKDPSSEDYTDAYLQDAYKKITQKDAYVEIKILDLLNKNPELVDNNPYLSDDFKQVLKDFDLRVFKIFNLGIKPEINPKKIIEDPGTYIPPLIIILIAVATTFLTTAQMMPQQQQKDKKKGKPDNSGCASKGMMWMSPIMTLWIGLGTPCGLSVYWTMNNILSFVQQKIMNKYFKKDNNSKKEENSVAKVNNKRG